MKTPQLHPDSREFLLCLHGHRVRFVVIGAHVLATLGRPRFTEDVDILTSSTGITFAEAWRGRQTIEIDERPIAFLGLAEYVKTKRACGRTKDLLDLALLEEAGLIPRAKPRARPKKIAKKRVRRS